VAPPYDSLGPKCDHGIDSRRTLGREPRRALGDEQQKDRQRKVDQRVGRVDVEERLLQEPRDRERAGDAGDDPDEPIPSARPRIATSVKPGDLSS
jgi:hypothetical protein